jgi:hypothetical protein
MRNLIFISVAIILPSIGCSDTQKIVPSGDKEVFHLDMPGIKIDPVEIDLKYADIFAQIDDEVELALKSHPERGKIGFVHIVWSTKAAILREKYKIYWRSPAEMNPDALFD